MKKYYRKLGKELGRGVFEAIICVYNKPDNEGVSVNYGAFSSATAKLLKGVSIPILYEHDRRDRIGEIESIIELPSGSHLLPEDVKEYGACVARARFDLKDSLGREVYGKLKSGELKNFSVGFTPQDVVYTSAGEPSEYLSCDLFEFSVVADPMHVETRPLVVYSNKQIEGRGMSEQNSLIGDSPFIENSGVVVYSQGKAGRTTECFESDEEALAVGYWIKAKSTPDAERQKEFLGAYKRYSRYKEVSYALTPSVNSQGGYLIPMGMLKAIEVVRRNYGVARKYCNVQVMKTLVEPTYILDSTEVVMTPINFESDAGIPDASIINIGQNLSAEWQKGKVTYSEVQDEYGVIKMADAFATAFGLAQSKLEDDYVFLANGEQTPYFGRYGVAQRCLAQQPLAQVATNPAVTSVANWGAITWEVLNPVINNWITADLKPVIFCSQEFWSNVLVDIILSVSNLTTGDLYNSPQRKFFGVPVEFVPQFPTATGAGTIPMLIADLGKCSTLGILEEQTVRIDNITNMGKMQSTAWYFSAMDHLVYNVGKLDPNNATKRYAQAAKIVYCS